MIEHLNKLPVEIVERFLEIRDSAKVGIPEKVGRYILQVNEAANLNRRYTSISECARKLQKVYPELSIRTCKERIYDAITYFNSDCSVTAESWNLYFADRMMKLSEINMQLDNLPEARICTERARKYRIEASSGAVDPNLRKFKHQIVSADMELERMGFKRKGLLESYRQAVTIISKLDTNDAEKKRLLSETEREFNISEADYEDY